MIDDRLPDSSLRGSLRKIFLPSQTSETVDGAFLERRIICRCACSGFPLRAGAEKGNVCIAAFRTETGRKR